MRASSTGSPGSGGSSGKRRSLARRAEPQLAEAGPGEPRGSFGMCGTKPKAQPQQGPQEGGLAPEGLRPDPDQAGQGQDGEEMTATAAVSNVEEVRDTPDETPRINDGPDPGAQAPAG